MGDKRAYFTLDVGYLTNPKIAPLLDSHPRAVLLHIECIAYAAQHLTDGVVPMLLAMRLACAEQCHMDMLMQCGLIEDRGDGNVAVHDYLEHQRSASAVKSASDKAQRAAAARWADAPSNAPSMPDALPTAMPREKERERERSTTLSPAPQAASGFAEWYSHYPRKTGKAAAEKAYAKALKRVDAPTLLSAVVRYKADPNLPEKQYIPHPSKWLNDGRWEDEPLPAKGGRPPTALPDRNDWMFR